MVGLSDPWTMVWLLWAWVFVAFSPLCCTALLYVMTATGKADYSSRELIVGYAMYCLPWDGASLSKASKTRSQCVIMGFLINASCETWG